MKSSIKRSFLLLLIYITLIVNYKYIIAFHFDYLGFQIQYFSVSKLFIATVMVILLIALGIFIRNNFYSIIYNISLTLLFFGQAIFYIYNDSDFILVLYMASPMLFLFTVDKFNNDKVNKFNKIKVDLKDFYTYIFLLFLTVILIAPYFQNINSINLKNLLFIDIYETRQSESNSSNFLMGYIFSPLSRVLLPFLFIYSVNNKKWFLTIFSTLSIIMIFLLNGALKSILIGFIAAIFFLGGSYNKKNSRFLIALFITFTVSLFQYSLSGSYLIADYIRRIFLTPAKLFQVYYDYFYENYTFFKHSSIAEILGVNEYDVFIPHFIGQSVLGRENLSANVGVFTEGFLSFGTLGVIFSSIIFVFLIYVIKQLNLSPSYFGIVFSFLYVINTAFIETLLFTHGLLFLLLFGFFFIPSDKGNIDYKRYQKK
ncbi:O-antigen polymerase [Virgibacillus necropolis]|uniref:Oligosaccharide repeat unit polymerase n=1 Tax=Virgibacillus necropolis TaxID=163877 RepID=A0A221M9C4_9BACI|nr:O-antigen polymerase [Virgibacillus necropolis]ASN04229.1 hypothetical protein CFK40_04005 [Virgibacillus necropolis]